MEQKVTSHISKGVIISLILIVMDLAGEILKVRFETWFGITSAVVSIGLFVWSPIQYSNDLKNNTTFGKLFSHGFRTTAVFISIMFIYTLIKIFILFPDFINQLIDMQFKKAAEQGQTVPDLSDEQMKTARKFTIGFFLAGVVFINLIIGVIGTLIGAAIAKKQPQGPFTNQAV